MRCFVVWSSVPPFRQLYLAVYALATRLAVAALARFPAVRAVYLKRADRPADFLPGVSDIDLVVVVHLGTRLPPYPHWLLNLLRKADLVDPAFGNHQQRRTVQRYAADPAFQMTVTRMRLTGQRVYGEPCFETLPALAGEDLLMPMHTQVQHWWQLFAKWFYGVTWDADDRITQNSVCYKAAAEVISLAEIVDRRGGLHFSRSEGLRRGRRLLTPDETRFAERLEALPRKRFLTPPGDLVEATHRFLLGFLDRYHADLARLPPLRDLDGEPACIDCPPEEVLRNVKTDRHEAALLEHLDREWGDLVRGVYVVPSVMMRVEEWAFLIQVDPLRLPSVEQLKRLAYLDSALREHIADVRRLRLYLLLPHAALHFGTDYMSANGWEIALCPQLAPDLFSLVTRPEFVRRDGGFQPMPAPPVRSAFLAQQFRAMGWNWIDQVEIRRHRQSSAYFHTRSFLKAAQVYAMLRLLERGEVRYPITPEAIRRAAADAGIPFPPALDGIKADFRRWLVQDEHSVGDRLPAMLAYVYSLDPETWECHVWPDDQPAWREAVIASTA